MHAYRLTLPHTLAHINLSPKEQAAVNFILRRTLHSVDAQEGWFINIHSDEWQSLLGSYDYKAVLESLARRGIIEINDRYSVGNWPKSYRLADYHRTPNCIEVDAAPRQRPPLQIRLDPDDAVCWQLVGNFEKVLLPARSRFKGWNRLLIQQIRGHQFYATRCAYGRFHSSFTGLNKAARRLLTTLGGEPLWELDVSHAQPLMLPAMMLKAGYSIDKSTRHFILLCESGKMYDWIASICKKMGYTLKDCYQPGTWGPHWEPQEIKRDPAKKAFIIVLFCPNEMMLGHPVFRVIEAEFPEVAQFMQDIKQVCHQQLARDCQRCESGIMIDQVCAYLMQQFGDIPLITVHDSILTTERHIPHVATAIRRFFGEMGINPGLKANDILLCA